MAGKFTDYNTAVRMHRFIVRVVTQVVNEIRPLPRYGVTVSAVNTMTYQVLVTLGKETSAISATCSPFLMPTVGSTVRVEGRDDDLFISAVMHGGVV